MADTEVKSLKQGPAMERSVNGGWRALWLSGWISEYWILLLSLLYFLVLWPITPSLASPENLRNLFSNMLPLLVVSIGQTVVLITGGIDLSATSIIGLSSILGALLMNSESGMLGGSVWAAPAGILTMIATGIVVGFLNGLAVTRLKMPAFIVTLTSMMFFSGLAILSTESRPIYNLPDGFVALGKGSQFLVPNSLIVVLAMAVAAHVLLSRTVLGHWIYAAGMNARTSLVSGVPVNRVLISAYVLSGFYAAVSSILFTGRLETGSPVLGQRILLDVIGASVLGGTSLFGGRGKVLWTVFGVWFICLIDNSLNMLGLSYFVVMVVKGGVILLASLLDSLRMRLIAGE